MSGDIVGMSRLFNPVRGYIAKRVAHLERAGKRPLLINIEHHQALFPDKFPQHMCAPDISFRIS